MNRFLWFPVKAWETHAGNSVKPLFISALRHCFLCILIGYIEYTQIGNIGIRNRYICVCARKRKNPLGNNDGKHGGYMRESMIERQLVLAVKKRGGLPLKFTSPGFDGMPDRLVLLPGGRIAFIETKAPGKKMRPLQIKRKRQLEALGLLVYCIDKPEQIGGVLDEIQAA